MNHVKRRFPIKPDLWDIGGQTVQNSFNITTYFLSHPSKFFLWICRSSGHGILDGATIDKPGKHVFIYHEKIVKQAKNILNILEKSVMW